MTAWGEVTADFVNPKSMLTPGVAGATSTLITGTLVSQFGLPGSWTALVVSFLIGFVLLTKSDVPLPQRALLYVLNALIIFSVAVGMNEAGRVFSKDPRLVDCQQRWVAPESEAMRFFQSWF
jgi:hypothetical protein